MTPSEIADLEFKLKSAQFQIEACDEQIERQASTIRAQADALKIATEALERMISLYEGEHDPGNLERPQWLVDALARIKEVG